MAHPNPGHAEHHPGHAEHHPRPSRTTPKDFFLWLGTVIALYSGITAFLALLFQYVDLAFPDPLAYPVDSFSTSIRVAMATLIVMVPLFLGLLIVIRRDIVREPGKANIWARRWALVLTIFIAGLTAAVDLITLLTKFLGGDFTVHFVLKALIVLLVSVVVCLHFLADYWGYWTLHRRKADMVGAGVGALAIMTIIAGFVLIGSPSHIRALRYDSQRVSDLENIQSQVVNYWQTKRVLPASLSDLNDPISGFIVPVDPETGKPYEYSVGKSNVNFSLCTTFDTTSQGTDTPRPASDYAFGENQNFSHDAGHTCFSRTIDEKRYPQVSALLK